MARPLIGISLDLVEEPRGPLYALHQLRAAYPDAIEAAGGAPVLLATLSDASLEAVLPKLDGVLLTGGAFDVPPELFGEAPSPKLGALKRARTDFELRLLRGAEARGRPILGICGGMQLMNVACGGTLYQHLPDELAGALEHEQPTDRRTPWHPVRVTEGSWLAGPPSLAVNSSHHQGIKQLGRGLRAIAHSSDGLIEAFEGEDRRWLGVEWHPELLGEVDPLHRLPFAWLVREARAP